MKKQLTLSLITLLLAGCGNLIRPPEVIPEGLKNTGIPIENPINSLAAPFDEIDSSALNVEKTLEISPLEASDPLPNFRVDNLNLSDASIAEALTLISSVHNFSFTIDRTVDGQLAQGNSFSADNISGTFEEVLNKLANSMGFFYYYKNNTLVIRPDMQFILTAPPVADLLINSALTISNLGGRSVSLNKSSGTISFMATKTAYTAIKNYMNYVKETRMVISYDTWIYEVSLTDNNETGIQWNKFGQNLGGTKSVGLVGSSLMQATSPFGMNLVYNGSKFNLDLLVSFLKTQGNLKTLSQPKIAVLNGSKGKIKAGRKITYISQVGQSTVGSTVSSSATTADLQLGTDLTLTANFSDGTIYTTIELKVDDLNELVVNNILGSQITLPDTINREMNTTVRSRPGDVILLGGVTTTREQDNGDGVPLGSKNMLQLHNNKQLQKSELVIILKPRVIKFKGI